MPDYLETLIDRISSSYWFVPTAMMLIAIILSIVTIQIDRSMSDDITWIVDIIYVDSAEGARDVLSTIASSMITVAGVVFSITMVVLSLTSQQFGPLILVHFLRDRGNQLVLGTFIATFVYCLLILRSIRGSDSVTFVPHFSVLIGIGMALASLGVLIFFIHHVTNTIQPTNILAKLASNLKQEMETLFPENMGEAGSDLSSEILANTLTEERLERESAYQILVRPSHSGYIRLIYKDPVINHAIKHGYVVRIECQLGRFVIETDILATIWFDAEPSEESLDEASIAKELRDAFVIGISRTQSGDVAFMFVQLVEIAVRSLSPSLNDPFTAIMCIDRLKEALILLALQDLPSRYRFDEDGYLRVIVPVIVYSEMIDLSYTQIIEYAKNDQRVLNHLITVFSDLLLYVTSAPDKETIHHYEGIVRQHLMRFEQR